MPHLTVVTTVSLMFNIVSDTQYPMNSFRRKQRKRERGKKEGKRMEVGRRRVIRVWVLESECLSLNPISHQWEIEKSLTLSKQSRHPASRDQLPTSTVDVLFESTLQMRT